MFLMLCTWMKQTSINVFVILLMYGIVMDAIMIVL